MIFVLSIVQPTLFSHTDSKFAEEDTEAIVSKIPKINLFIVYPCLVSKLN
jgi:hypothetical protein